MCVSLFPAHFSDTIVGAFEAADGRRYLAYQNTAANLAVGAPKTTAVAATTRKPVRRGTRRAAGSGNWSFEEAVTPKATGKTAPAATGNAMILPIPDAVGNIELIDTTSCPNFLKDIRSALTPRTRGALRRGSNGADSAKSVRIIEFDVYTIVIAKSAKDLAKVIKSDAIREDRRPALNDEIFKAYAKWYPNWAIAVCCFNNTDAQRAKPLLFSYEPTKQEDKGVLFVPTLDAHDGKAPDLNARVDVDHTVFVATPDMSEAHGMTVFYSDPAIELGVAELLPRKVLGKVITGSYRNGDIVFKCSDLKSGVVRGLRALPPGAPKSDVKEFI
jgi:hypothetical protein